MNGAVYHAAKLFGVGVANNRYDSFGSDGEQFEGDGIVAAQNFKALWGVLHNVFDLSDLPEASLIATTLGHSLAMRKVVAASMFTPVRPGTL